MPDAPPLTAPPPAPVPPEGAAPPRRTWRSWAKVIAVALLASLLLRLFAFEAYRIPSASMEETLLVGDYLFVSKLHYGPRLPLTFSPPFTSAYVRGLELPAVRLPGFSAVERGDVVVFNYPPQDGPVDRRMPYIKRVVALPGDTVQLVNKIVFVNGVGEARPPGARQLWRVRLEDDAALAAPEALAALGLRGRLDRSGPAERLFEGTNAQAEHLRGVEGVVAVEPLRRPPGDRSAGFPTFPGYSLDDYGPVLVPHAGLTVELDEVTWPLYRDALRRYEGVEVQRVAGGFEIGGALTSQYTFTQDYFFVLGDNRDASADSRSWGFVPADHVIGKAVLVYFSKDPTASWWDWRWDRMLRQIE